MTVATTHYLLVDHLSETGMTCSIGTIVQNNGSFYENVFGRLETSSLTRRSANPILSSGNRIRTGRPLNKSQYISILLVGLVMLCPFQCIFGGCLAGDIGDDAVACSVCDHCSGPVDNEEPNPSSPSDCNCGDCFCRGALPVDEATQDIVLTELVSYMTSWVKLDLTQVELPTGQVQRHSNVLSIDASALEVRAALCCWLI